MNRSRKRSVVVNCVPLHSMTSHSMQFSRRPSCFHTVRGGAPGGNGGSRPPGPPAVSAFLDGSIYLSTSPWVEAFSCYSSHCCGVQHAKPMFHQSLERTKTHCDRGEVPKGKTLRRYTCTSDSDLKHLCSSKTWEIICLRLFLLVKCRNKRHLKPLLHLGCETESTMFVWCGSHKFDFSCLTGPEVKSVHTSSSKLFLETQGYLRTECLAKSFCVKATST